MTEHQILTLKKRTLSPVFTFLFLPLTLLWGCEKPPTERINAGAIPTNFVNGSFVVELADGSASSAQTNKSALDKEANSVAAEFGCQFAESRAVAWTRSEQTSGLGALENVYHLNFEQCQLDQNSTREIVSRIADIANVNTVEAEGILSPVEVENDPSKPHQYYLETIRRDEACSLAAASQRPVVVAVVDSGVQRDHPDLVNAFLKDASGKVIGANFHGKGSDLPPDEEWDDLISGHGTHVAGIIAAEANNHRGIAGVAGCANVKIMPVRVLGPDQEGKIRGNSITTERGVQWAIENGADIINMSLGSYGTYLQPRTTHQKAIYDYASNQGVMVFAAAGNETHDNGTKNPDLYREQILKSATDEEAGQYYLYHYPSTFNKVVSVASTTQDNELSDFSNRGFKTDIAAPGSGILSTYKGSTYTLLNGTSMATPVAVGSYAVALSAIRGSQTAPIVPDAVRQALRTSTIEPGHFDTSVVNSSGVINAEALTNAVKEMNP
jgi:subtilisin family serine protease